MQASAYYFPVIWLIIAAIVVGVFASTSGIAYFRHKMMRDPKLGHACDPQLRFLQKIRWVLWSLAILLTLGGVAMGFVSRHAAQHLVDAKRQSLLPQYDKSKIWSAPDPYLAESDPQAALIAYGRDLIVNTQDYFGASGLLRPGSINGMNCQNCHLEAGTKAFGNNYFAVASTYPQMRARSGALETIPKRINDCFLRSLNGQAIDTTGKEMKAILAYMQWLGTGIPKGEKPKGSGLYDLKPIARAADPQLGQKIYAVKCASCHGQDGQGGSIPGEERRYPPLWGDQSYNAGAGLFRLSRFAAYIKANMPFGATYLNPQLSDEESWDLAAFVNSRPRPEHPFLQTDWPDISKKPYDHPFGPYADTFPETQHKFGPFGPIIKK